MSIDELNNYETSSYCCPEQQEVNIGYLSLSSEVRYEVKKLNKENNIQLDENTIEKIVLFASTLNAQEEQFSENSIFFLDNAIVFPREKAIAIPIKYLGLGRFKTVHECALIIFKENALIVKRKALITISAKSPFTISAKSPSDEDLEFYSFSVKQTLQGNKILETFRNCTFITNPYDCWGEGLNSNKNKIFASIADLYDTDLFKYKLPYLDTIKALLDVSKGLNFLHKGGYVHSDIKSDNFLFRYEGQAVLADFDLSGRKDDPWVKGAVSFRPPEMLLGECRKLRPENDIWAMGIIFLQFFHSDTSEEIENMAYDLLSGDLDRNQFEELLLEKLERLDDSSTDAMLNNLIKNCLKINPNERCSAEEIARTLQVILEKESQEVLKAS